MNEVIYPDVHVQLSGKDGNAFAILAAVQKAMRKAGVENAEISKYNKEATSGDYDNLLQVTQRWVSVS